MAIELADLIARLKDEAPEMGGVPTETGYTNCITSAVADFSGKLPIRRHTTIDIVPGTPTYTLPDDFAGLIWLETWAQNDDVLVTTSGLIPLSSGYQERYYFEGLTLRIIPTPPYPWSGRGLQYNARHVLSGLAEDTYALMTEADVEVFMPLAVALALGLQANKQAQQIPQHRTRDGGESRESMVDSMRGRIKDSEALYKSRIADAKRKRATTIRAEYSEAETARMLSVVT